ncbi:deoxyribonuclease TATDN2 [Mizuhopecten yessoensis]|uniref:Deoxyribonuclease TATDN2 n=2 Tax=Mizuhopecten yessoensis TaxID=6573 RepID=A0A210QBG5_MIZYE|nr:deoxyribonuclease TATDN2 [Mizuhopecten yessoensis]
MRCLDVVRKMVPPEQKIQLHCFSGTEEVIQAWLTRFPNTCFSVSRMVSKFNDAQRHGVKCIPSTRLLIETDAPYYSVSPEFPCSAPHLVDHTARRISQIRGSSVCLGYWS